MTETMVEVPVAALDEIRSLYEDGLYLQAYERSREFGPLADWTETDSRVLAGRLAHHLGGMRISRLQLTRAWLQAPTNMEVAYYYGYTVLERKGPWATRLFLRDFEGDPSDEVDILSSWYSLHAVVASSMRDFENADMWIRKAAETDPQSVWVQTVKSHLLEAEDRYDEALEQALSALEMKPMFRPAVQAQAHLLWVLGRDTEALDVLKAATERIESSALAQQLLAQQIDVHDYDGAEQSLERLLTLAPLLDKNAEKQVASCRAEIDYFRNDFDATVEWSKKADSKFCDVVAERLSDPEVRKAERKVLDMPFVRQHHLTCVPATLTSIAHFWDRQVDHLELAEEICYAGTSALNERRWSTSNGWAVREFTVTEDSVKSLIDAGIPCTLTTIAPGNGHMQAINGYDARRGTFVILDPYVRKSEALAEKLLENQAAFGPRGMAMVPEEQAARLAAIDLPDADLWDRLHELDACLDEHRREDAIVVLEALEQAAPTHRLALEAKRRLAVYDANPQAMLAAVESLLETYPEDEALHLQRLSLLRNQSRRSDQLEAYQKLYDSKDCHPMIAREYAEELRNDHSEVPRALFYLKRVLRQTPGDGHSYHSLGRLLWELHEDDRETTLEMFRLAACMGDHDENLSETYLIAAQHLRQTDAALAFLRKRFERFGKKSGWPGQTLCQACRRMNRHGEAMDVIREAVQLRPDDGELLLYAADVFASAGTNHYAEARSFLSQAEGKATRPQWLRTSAFISSVEGDLEEALSAWQEVAELQPLSVDAHASVARLLAETKDTETALEWLNDIADRFPYHIPMQELRISWLRSEAPDQAEACIRQTLERLPDNDWLIRELAFLLVEKKELDEVEELIERAAKLDQKSAPYHHLVAALHLQKSEPLLAREAFRKALEQGVDNSHAMSELLECCQTADERRQELNFIAEQLKKQVTQGEGLVVFRALAKDTLDAEELLQLLEEAHSERPDLWHSWSALAGQYSAMNQMEKAHEVISEATEHFPLLPRLWVDRATISRARSNFDDEKESLQKAWAIDPFWHPVVDALCDLHERDGNRDEARKLLEQLVQNDPLESRHHSRLAELLWKMDEREAALERVERAVLTDPGNRDAWNALQHWSTIQETPERPLELARELTRKRPDEARSWLVLARILSGPETLDEQHAAIDRALVLNERCLEAYSIRAELFAEAGDMDAARAACTPEVFGDSPPSDLQLTLAYLEVDASGIKRAIEILEATLEADRGFHSGWLQLADWYRALNNADRYLECAREIARIEPHDPLSLGYLGEALASTENEDEAIDLFQRAFKVAPAYEFAGFMLFDLLLDHRKAPVAAADVLNRLSLHVEPSPRLDGRRIQVLSAQKERDAAFEQLRSLCQSEGELNWPLGASAEAMSDAGWGVAMRQTLEEMMEHDDVNSEVGAVWAYQCAKANDSSYEKKLKDLASRCEAGERAVHEFLSIQVETDRRDNAIRYVKKNRKWLKKSTDLWGTGGFVFAASLKYKDVVKWMADWREREGVKAWMLFNLVEGLRALGRDDEARVASQFCLDLPEAEPAQDLHRLWLALEDPLKDPELTAYCVTRIDPQSLNPGTRFMQSLLVAVFQMAGGFGEPASFSEVRQTVKQAVNDYKQYLSLEAGHRRYLKRTIKLIAENYSGIGPWLFGLSRFTH